MCVCGCVCVCVYYGNIYGLLSAPFKYVCMLSHFVLSNSSQPWWTLVHQAPLSMDSPGKTMEWIAISSFRGSSCPRDRTCVSYVSCIGRQIHHLHHLGWNIILLTLITMLSVTSPGLTHLITEVRTLDVSFLNSHRGLAKWLIFNTSEW